MENMLAQIKNMDNVTVYANSLYKNLEDSRLSLRGIKKISYTGFSVVYRFFRLLYYFYFPNKKCEYFRKNMNIFGGFERLLIRRTFSFSKKSNGWTISRLIRRVMNNTE